MQCNCCPGPADFDPTCNTHVDMLPWQSDIVLTPSVYTVAPPDPLNPTPTLVPLPLAAHEACVNCTSGHVIPRRQRATIRRSQLEGGVIKGSLSTPFLFLPPLPHLLFGRLQGGNLLHIHLKGPSHACAQSAAGCWRHGQSLAHLSRAGRSPESFSVL